jgi:hypothetical protein
LVVGAFHNGATAEPEIDSAVLARGPEIRAKTVPAAPTRIKNFL